MPQRTQNGLGSSLKPFSQGAHRPGVGCHCSLRVNPLSRNTLPLKGEALPGTPWPFAEASN